jgi:UDP-N-acetylmuramoyl-tripeptide--D-alanyl-D-alanine ligase
LFQALGDDGVAVVNADDRFADLWRGFIGTRRTLRFGMKQSADVAVLPGTERMEVGDSLAMRFVLRTSGGDVAVRMQLCGRHNALNACAAAAAALAVGATSQDIERGLAGLQTVKGRLQLKLAAPGLRILDDTYNANPNSLRAALQVLAMASGGKIMVLGDMGELGPGAQDMHADMGEEARADGVEKLFTVGMLSRFTAERFGAGARHFSTQAELITALSKTLNETALRPVTILVKGSRRMQMERVVEALMAPDDGETSSAAKGLQP